MTEKEKTEIKTGEITRTDLEWNILGAANSSEFKNAISPQNPERIDSDVLNRALDTILSSGEVEIPESQRLQLFKDTLEYYSTPPEAEVPLLHSTSSFSLRNGLESGFKGGYGKYTGEAAALAKKYGKKTKWTAQKDLSVSHPVQPHVEEMQQIYARASARKDELGQYLVIDSEKITGKDLPGHFMDSFLSSHPKDELAKIVATRQRKKIEDITDADIKGLRNEAIDTWGQMGSTPEKREMEREILPTITDENLKSELEYEIEHPFPCFITFEGGGNTKSLRSVLEGKMPTHIPFEDRFKGTFTGEDIREIRVPQNQIEKVRGWLNDKKLENVKIVPIEVYEIKRIIQDSTR